MGNKINNLWNWQGWDISWSLNQPNKESNTNVLLIHGFGASKEHWRNNQTILGNHINCYAIDLLGFGQSSQPKALLDYESNKENHIKYCFDLWGNQIADFCNTQIKSPVILIGNSIGGIASLKAAELLDKNCQKTILLDCAQRTMDDKRINEKDILMNFIRPILKTLVRQRFISNTLFRQAANKKTIRQILKQAYPSGKNIDDELINILYKPSQRKNSAEAFRGFINLFDDYLATDLFETVKCDIHLVWGEKDPWESIEEAKYWKNNFGNIKSLDILEGVGHCPHDENPAETNKILLKLIQDTK
tara:strand:+ start:1653 stop:2564 length:912 start_codon:yes stop_codon:yes gene_type:complete